MANSFKEGKEQEAHEETVVEQVEQDLEEDNIREEELVKSPIKARSRCIALGR